MSTQSTRHADTGRVQSAATPRNSTSVLKTPGKPALRRTQENQPPRPASSASSRRPQENEPTRPASSASARRHQENESTRPTSSTSSRRAHENEPTRSSTSGGHASTRRSDHDKDGNTVRRSAITDSEDHAPSTRSELVPPKTPHSKATAPRTKARASTADVNSKADKDGRAEESALPMAESVVDEIRQSLLEYNDSISTTDLNLFAAALTLRGPFPAWPVQTIQAHLDGYSVFIKARTARLQEQALEEQKKRLLLEERRMKLEERRLLMEEARVKTEAVNAARKKKEWQFECRLRAEEHDLARAKHNLEVALANEN